MAVRRWLTRALTVAAVAASGVVGVSSTAHAYLNTCYPVHGGNWGGGRCTGSGTDWSYRPAVRCNNNPNTWQIGSNWSYVGGTSLYKNCSGSGTALQGGLALYYYGEFRAIHAD